MTGNVCEDSAWRGLTACWVVCGIAVPALSKHAFIDCRLHPHVPQHANPTYRGVLFSSNVKEALNASRMRLTRVRAASCRGRRMIKQAASCMAQWHADCTDRCTAMEDHRGHIRQCNSPAAPRLGPKQRTHARRTCSSEASFALPAACSLVRAAWVSCRDRSTP